MEAAVGPGVLAFGSGNGWYFAALDNKAGEGPAGRDYPVGSEVFFYILRHVSFRGVPSHATYDQASRTVVLQCDGWANLIRLGAAQARIVITQVDRSAATGWIEGNATFEVYRGEELVYTQTVPMPLQRCNVTWQ